MHLQEHYSPRDRRYNPKQSTRNRDFIKNSQSIMFELDRKPRFWKNCQNPLFSRRGKTP